MKTLFLAALLLPASALYSQHFFNGDLEGAVTWISVLPYGWDPVSATNPICLANNEGNATADLTGYEGPDDIECSYGNPYSGQTFVSGLQMANPNTYHEGIQQLVDGFQPDSTYTISFFQSNIKQPIALDTSGSWAVYIDNELVGVTEPSISHLPPNSFSVNWDYREVSFVATSTYHLIQFMPYDDDPNYAYSDGIRMGIDYIYIGEPFIVDPETPFVMSNVFTPNEDGINDLFAPVELGAVKSIHTEIFNRWGNRVYETTDPYIQWDGRDIVSGEPCQAGVYFWVISGTAFDFQSFSRKGIVIIQK
jgi:gliding motility-associated-like protein